MPKPAIKAQDDLTPSAIVRELDKFIIGQNDAKRVVAIALRNRMRRRLLEEPMREEVIPKNIIMIGPTGVGKTEIARRLSRLVKAPFVKVEASKFTEVGYVGRDVESMVRDLVETSVNMVREELMEQVRPEAEKRAREKLLDQLDGSDQSFRRRFISGVGNPEGVIIEGGEPGGEPGGAAQEDGQPTSREKLAKLLDEGYLETREIEVEIRAKPAVEGMFGIAGMDEQMMGGLRDMMEKMMPEKKHRSKLTVAEARKMLVEQEMEMLIDQEKVKQEALTRAEQTGIIFVDEIDKIASRQGGAGPDVSREGVQRDILPIVEGSTVFTKHGIIRTDHILFIAAGAFHTAKPSDLIPELQGRFPLRVQLDSLDVHDLKRILVEPENSLIKQYIALMGTDGVELTFEDGAIDELAKSSARLNDQAENIGARRLHAVLERVLDPIAFDAPDNLSGPFTIDRAFVIDRLKLLVEDQDLSRFIL